MKPPAWQPAVGLAGTRCGPRRLRAVLGPTGVEECLAEAPWKLFGPLAVPGKPHSYVMANVTAGIFGGDRLEAQLTLLPRAQAWVTAPAATRVHSSVDGGWACQRLEFHIGEGAQLWYWPNQIIPLAGSLYRQEVSFRLAQGAGLVAAEVLAPGRLAMGEAFAYRCLLLSTSIFMGEELVLRDRALLRPMQGWLLGPGALAGYIYVASLYVAGKARQQLARLELVGRWDPPADTLLGCSRPHPSLWVARVLGRDLEPVLTALSGLVPTLL